MTLQNGVITMKKNISQGSLASDLFLAKLAVIFLIVAALVGLILSGTSVIYSISISDSMKEVNQILEENKKSMYSFNKEYSCIKGSRQCFWFETNLGFEQVIYERVKEK